MKPENIHPELQERLKNAKSIEEIREIATEANCEFSEEELNAMAGGLAFRCKRDTTCMLLNKDYFGPPIV